VSTTEILEVIGGITLILTNAAHIPAALARFIDACVPVVTAARRLRAALTGRGPQADPDAHSDVPGDDPDLAPGEDARAIPGSLDLSGVPASRVAPDSAGDSDADDVR
jgi:hypothetical protein